MLISDVQPNFLSIAQYAISRMTLYKLRIPFGQYQYFWNGSTLAFYKELRVNFLYEVQNRHIIGQHQLFVDELLTFLDTVICLFLDGSI